MKKILPSVLILLAVVMVMASCTSSRKVGCPMSGGQTARYRSYK